MEKERIEKLNDDITAALVAFVLRVAADRDAKPAELAALPVVAEIVCNRI